MARVPELSLGRGLPYLAECPARRRPGDKERGDRVHPRVRARHPTWTLEALQGLAWQRTRVGINGQDHARSGAPGPRWQSRSPIWEIHLVMKGETQRGLRL